ncbi:glycoside hydrolase family 16 protein [Streptomyces sp. W16]|uniref:glycoside hydrolase family 16 protein n=1 Tax=Streptomyces sp. W16 TaxID=3076631 RepID=UPI00295A6981|nr:glycoside hydrolase family 16 protein [Streptomyces sp. W16]MDV9175111.1 glycoside hydrolase family 16 protein [Streptomyces sp. W16]
MRTSPPPASAPAGSQRTVPLVLGSALLLLIGTLVGLIGSGGSASAAVPGAPTGWTTLFSDDFNGSSGSALNRTDWLYDLGTSYAGGAANWGTGEVESATDSTNNVYQDGQGHLVIKALRDGSGHWTSGRIETQRTDFAAPAGGQLQMSASILQPNPQSGLGYWPAFWAMGGAARPVGATNWPSIGEFDIMEDVNALSKHSTTFHCGVWAGECHDPDGITSDLQPCAGCQTGYHTYSAIIDRTNTSAEQLRFYLDGNLTFTVNENQVSVATWQAAVDHGFMAIFDLAIAGSYPDKVCGCSSAAQAGSITSGAAMSVDWFAVYQQSPSGSTTGGTTGSTTGGSTGGSTTTPDYTAGVTHVSANQAQITFVPTTPAAYVDVHYLVNGSGQQNFRMTNSGGTWTQNVALTTGSTLTYWFTYEKNGPQYDSPHYTYVQ